jgi:cyanophycinase
MRPILALLVACATVAAAGTISAFGHRWTVPVAADWAVDRQHGAEVLRLVQNRGPLPGPRRPIQFALAEIPDSLRVTFEADVKPLGSSLLIVFAYHDPSHFDYAHLSIDAASKQPVHNGIFHVYGGERVRISSERGPAAFAESRRWYRVRLVYDGGTGRVRVTVDDHPVPALEGVDVSLGAGRVGLGSFDETAEFKNVRMTAEAPAVALMGGSKDLDPAFRWLCSKAAGGSMVVLTSSPGSDNAYDDYIRKLCPTVGSVATLVIHSTEDAKQAAVASRIADADAVFITGGSQDNYVNFWTGTPVQEMLNKNLVSGKPIGGTSAGLAVLGQYAFAALNDTVTSGQALADPYDRRVTVVRDFLAVPYLEGKITDSHFVARDRLGRLLVFLARIIQDGWSSEADGIGIDEKNAALLESDGTVTLVGDGAAYFLHASGLPEVCRKGTPLTYRHISAYRMRNGGRFDVKMWKGTGGTAYTLSVENGVVKSDQPGGSIY